MPQDHPFDSSKLYTGPVGHDEILWAQRHGFTIGSLVGPTNLPSAWLINSTLTSDPQLLSYNDPNYQPPAALVAAATYTVQWKANKHQANVNKHKK